MASRLEEHEQLIIDKLRKGKSYSSIAKLLKDMGCKTSTQNLFTWTKRRPARLKARQALADALRPQPSGLEYAPTSSILNTSQVFLTSHEKNKINQTPQVIAQTKERSAENDILDNLRKKQSVSLLPIIFNEKNFEN